MTWLEVRLAVSADQADAAAEVFRRFCYGGVAVEEPVVPDPEGEIYAPAAGLPWVVKGYLPVGRGVGLRQYHLRRALAASVASGDFLMRRVEEEDWATAWKAYFKPLRVGRGLVVRPAWEAYDPEPGDVVLDLDPGMAFGTGAHATTRLCLAALERKLQRGRAVLDLGTGSGILAIAAAKLGAEAVLALDTDPIAVTAAQRNVALNGLSDKITLAQGSLDHPAVERFGPADLIVANITAASLLDLAPGIVAALRPGGVLILSGVLAERQGEVSARFGALGCSLEDAEQDEDWCALVLRASGAITDPAVLGRYGKPPQPPLRGEQRAP